MIYTASPNMDTFLFPREAPAGEIVLGEEGRGGRRRVVVPIIGRGKFATFMGGAIITGEEEAADECLVGVFSNGGYSRGREYDMLLPHGVTVLARGEGREGIAGRVGGWTDYLVRLDHEGGFTLRGKYGSEVVALNLSGSVHVADAAKISAWRTATLMASISRGDSPSETDAILKILTDAQKEMIQTEATQIQRRSRRGALLFWASNLGMTEEQLIAVEKRLGVAPFRPGSR